jgi:Family of unknown function (DUF6263)
LDLLHNNILFKPRPGSTYEFELNEHKQIKNSVNGRVTKNQSEHNNHAVLTFEWKDSKPENGYNALVNFKSLQQTTVFAIDSFLSRQFNAPDSPYQKALKAFDGASFLVDVGLSGKITAIEGHEKFKKHFDSLYNQNGTSINPALWVMFPRQYFVLLFETFSALLPDTPVSIGSRWSRQEVCVTGDPTSAAANYYVSEIKGNMAYIKVSYIVDHSESDNSSTQTKGTGTGEIQFDVATGLPVRMQKTIVITRTFTDGPIVDTSTIVFEAEFNVKSNGN